MAANLQVLVDSLDEGMLIVSPEGVVRLANQAARRFFTVVVGKRLAVEELMVQVAAAKAQAALMAPTDILARQHAQTITPIAEALAGAWASGVTAARTPHPGSCRCVQL